jgi:hypothetical protein
MIYFKFMGDGHPPPNFPNAGLNSATTLSYECLPPLGFLYPTHN